MARANTGLHRFSRGACYVPDAQVLCCNAVVHDIPTPAFRSAQHFPAVCNHDYICRQRPAQYAHQHTCSSPCKVAWGSVHGKGGYQVGISLLPKICAGATVSPELARPRPCADSTDAPFDSENHSNQHGMAADSGRAGNVLDGPGVCAGRGSGDADSVTVHIPDAANIPHAGAMQPNAEALPVQESAADAVHPGSGSSGAIRAASAAAGSSQLEQGADAMVGSTHQRDCAPRPCIEWDNNRSEWRVNGYPSLAAACQELAHQDNIFVGVYAVRIVALTLRALYLCCCTYKEAPCCCDTAFCIIIDKLCDCGT